MSVPVSSNPLGHAGTIAYNPPNYQESNTNPPTGYQPGMPTLWDNVATASVFFSRGDSNWIALGGGSTAIATINSVSPVAGNFNILGTANQLTVTNGVGGLTLSLPAAVTLPGSLTVTSGGVTVTAGNAVLNGAASQLRVHGGAVTDFIGTATLVSGTVTIANTNIASTDRIIIQRIAANASTTLGEFSYTISAATSFTITSLILGTPASTQTADVSSVFYFIVRQV